MFKLENEKKFFGRYITCIVLVICIFLGFVAQLVNWQLVHGEQYREKADSNRNYSVKVEAARGEILDVNGVDLAVNITGYNVVFNKVYAQENNQNNVILTLINIFNSRGEKWIDELPIVVDEDGNYSFVQDKESKIAQLKKDYRLNSYATAKDCINILASEKWYNCENFSPEDKRNVLSVRYNMARTGYSNETKYTFATGVSQDMVAIVSENGQKIKGVEIDISPVRKYVNGLLAPHIVGTIGAISQEEYDEKKSTGIYKLNSKIGKSGIEKSMEDVLIGKDGYEIIETTPDGGIVGRKEGVKAESGDTVYLTLDARLQRIAANALGENIPKAQALVGSNVDVSGSVAMLNVKDFSVLCAQSYPTFDLGAYYEDNNYYNQVLEAKGNPLYPRVFEGAYTIGSTMKPAVALAALEEGVITSNTNYYCGHTYQRFAPSYTPVCMGTHGSLNLQRAMAVSCNIFFYETGFNLGISNMNLYQSRLGLGQKTGVEIYERSGVLAGPEERKAAGGTWYDGDTIAAAIGQSDNLITPIQLATYAATIANNGVRLRTHLISKITDYSRQNVISENNASNIDVMDTLDVSQENLDIVKDAMRSVVTRSDGTAYYSFGSYEVPIAAKTGTAENVDNSPDHSTFIAFAPYDDPQVAIGIIIEHGKTGTWAANIAKALFDGYFKNIGMEDVPKTNPDGSVAS